MRPPSSMWSLSDSRHYCTVHVCTSIFNVEITHWMKLMRFTKINKLEVAAQIKWPRIYCSLSPLTKHSYKPTTKIKQGTTKENL